MYLNFRFSVYVSMYNTITHQLCAFPYFKTKNCVYCHSTLHTVHNITIETMKQSNIGLHGTAEIFFKLN